MVDYSKWDRLELSDDSDIEVHPNVDKRSFIRAKQRMIHEERHKRKQNIADLKSQRIINDELLRRIRLILSALQTRAGNTSTPEEQVFRSMMETAQLDDKPPVLLQYEQSKETQPTYNMMMAQLLDKVKKEVDQSKEHDRWKAYKDAFDGHLQGLVKVQAQAAAELARLEKEEASKITSESYHDGFDVGYVNKAPAASKPKEKKATTTVEQINPHATPTTDITKHDSVSSGAEADVEEDEDGDSEGSIKPTALGLAFAKIKVGDYRKCMEFISQHPTVVSEKEENGLLIEAFNSQMDGKEVYARQCVHQALLLQYCRQLGPDGVGLFFRRITTKGHQAQQVFVKDVAETYMKLRNRADELAKERLAAVDSEGAGVETIQLQAVEPGTTITISVPRKHTTDAEEQRCRQIFESFPPNLQKALESNSLDEVNKVLARMNVEDAEEVVAKLGEGQMLSLEQGIIDGTTEEGKAQLAELERAAKERLEAGEQLEDLHLIEDDLPVEGIQSSRGKEKET